MAAKPVEIELKHPYNEEFNTSDTGGTGIYIKLAGPMSTQFNQALEVFNQTEKTDADGLDFFCSCILGWDEEAFEMPFTKENAKKVFSQPENSWQLTQLTSAVQDAKNFFRVS